MLDSLKTELLKGDAVTIVFDGPSAKSKSGFKNSWLIGHLAKINSIEQTPALGYWGHGVRTKYQSILTPRTTFIMHADDDDLYSDKNDTYFTYLNNGDIKASFKER
jgi:hypothetical protein